ncbi:hypothetical protein ABZ714_11270 [Streptomyces sp. NPDC006798]|uniref:hypothetical protein n=1 Tax=Streptomyces sp. NPDC006798 TaxID=3155462 RepID=UPI00340A1E78
MEPLPPAPGARPAADPETATGPADDYLLGLHLGALTDQLNRAPWYSDAAIALDQILEPNRGLLEKLADFFEAAAEKAREAESDEGFDLHDDLTNAAADVRQLSEELHLAVDQMRDLSAPHDPGPQAPTKARASAVPPPPPALPPPGRTR